MKFQRHFLKSLRSQGVLGTTLLIAAASIGCFSRGEKQPPLERVTGSVKIQGRPVSRVKVLFEPRENFGPSWGVTQDDGRFEVYYSVRQPGAVRGKHRVQFHSERLTEEGASEGSEIVIPRNYRIGAEGLEVDVSDGANDFQFELSEKKS